MTLTYHGVLIGAYGVTVARLYHESMARQIIPTAFMNKHDSVLCSMIYTSWNWLFNGFDAVPVGYLYVAGPW